MTQQIVSYSATVKHYINGKGAITSQFLSMAEALAWLTHWPHAVAIEVRPNLLLSKKE